MTKAKPLVAGKPNPNIGMGVNTPSGLPQFGEAGWVNPNFDLYHNANGYHRFDPTIPGMGLQMSRNYADGARSFNAYQALPAGAPGSALAKDALQFMIDNGINPATSNDIQKFAAMDYAGRHVQWKNQRPKRKFTLKQAFGTVVQVAATIYGGPWGAAAGSAFNTALQGGDLGDIAKSAVIGGATSYAGGALSNYASAGSAAGSGLGATVAGYGPGATTLGRIATGVGTAYKTVAPYLNTGLQVGAILADQINRSGVNLTPAQYNALKGGNPKLPPYHAAPPTSADYAASYSGAPHSAYTAPYSGAGTRPINAAPSVPINTPRRNAVPYAAPKPYVAPPRVQIAPNIPIVNYDASRNYPSPATMQQAAPNIPIVNYDASRNYPSSTTMQQALMFPTATTGPARKNAATGT